MKYEYIKYLLAYFIIINLIAFCSFYIDKRKAKKDKWRISENTLHFISFIGGATGSISAMFIFHHKTKKTKFCVITTVACMLNIFLYFNILWMIFK